MTLAEELAESGILRKYLESVIADGRSIIFAKEHIEALLRSLEIDINAAILTERERCCKAVCEWCAGKDTGSPLDIVDPVPYNFGKRRYVPNVGEVEGWAHKCNWAECLPCEASPIREKEDTTVDDQHPGV
jgi:hypothetical protein